MVLAGVGAPLGVEDGVQREGRVALHDVGQLETGREEGVREGPAALGTVAHPVELLPAPVLGDALPAEVVLAAEADGVLVDAEADGTEELVLQAASHLQRRGPSGIDEGNALGAEGAWFNLPASGLLPCARR